MKNSFELSNITDEDDELDRQASVIVNQAIKKVLANTQ